MAQKEAFSPCLTSNVETINSIFISEGKLRKEVIALSVPSKIFKEDGNRVTPSLEVEASDELTDQSLAIKNHKKDGNQLGTYPAPFPAPWSKNKTRKEKKKLKKLKTSSRMAQGTLTFRTEERSVGKEGRH